MDRYLLTPIQHDLKKKMVFLGGPRQVGKTTLSQSICPSPSGYLNWDIPAHRERILSGEWPGSSPTWVFDEIHKYKRWRNLMKGLWDEHRGKRQILVTGSARLDFYRYGGDSLQGRYHYWRLHPFSLAELGSPTQSTLDALLQLGGFPEPFLSGSEDEARRWSREYRSRLMREEITSIERISDLGQMELLMIRLPELVGSPLSLNNLREDLQVSHRAVARWVDVLERFYAVFRVPPLGAPRLRAVKKEQKHYHYDWSLVPDPGLRFENLVGSHLLKWVHYKEDKEGRDMELRYFRDTTGREVDFVVTENRKPTLFVECKLSEGPLSPHLAWLCQKFPKVPAWQVHAKGTKDVITDHGVRIAPATKLLADLV